jgi:hypothetical protein
MGDMMVKVYRIINNHVVDDKTMLSSLRSIIHSARELRKTYPVCKYDRDYHIMYFTDYDESNGYFLRA